MEIPVEFWIVAAALISGTGCTLITCAFAARRMFGLYGRGWTAGREFATRELRDQLPPG